MYTVQCIAQYCISILPRCPPIHPVPPQLSQLVSESPWRNASPPIRPTTLGPHEHRPAHSVSQTTALSTPVSHLPNPSWGSKYPCGGCRYDRYIMMYHDIYGIYGYMMLNGGYKLAKFPKNILWTSAPSSRIRLECWTANRRALRSAATARLLIEISPR